MPACNVKFQNPVSRETVNSLVIEYLKYVLYYRGQFPLPLDQLKRTVQTYENSNPVTIGNHLVYQDNAHHPSGILTKPKKSNDRCKKLFINSIQKFDDFFKQLLGILQDEEVLEVIMNLGANMMSPKEMYRITLPSTFQDSCVHDPSAFHRCRLEFFRILMHSTILQDAGLDNPIQISVLLKLKTGGSLKEYMEQKRFYTPPQKCKQFVVNFDSTCKKEVDINCLENITPSNTPTSDLWVKLKSELKGFKNIIETESDNSSIKIF